MVAHHHRLSLFTGSCRACTQRERSLLLWRAKNTANFFHPLPVAKSYLANIARQVKPVEADLLIGREQATGYESFQLVCLREKNDPKTCSKNICSKTSSLINMHR